MALPVTMGREEFSKIKEMVGVKSNPDFADYFYKVTGAAISGRYITESLNGRGFLSKELTAAIRLLARLHEMTPNNQPVEPVHA